MLRRKPLRRKEWERIPREDRIPMALSTLQPVARGTYAGGVSGARPKSEPKRNPHLLAMARGMFCLLLAPGVTEHDRETVVSCHSNESAHGKAGARKADDQYSVWGCFACHQWLDFGPASQDEKRAAFMSAHFRQVEAWRGIAEFDPFTKDKAAAKWALDQLNATPVGAMA
jgi:hypothetical protein